MNVFRKKSLASIRENIKVSGLKRNLNVFDLIILGLGSIIGTGVFVLTGLVAAKYSGPAVMISFAIAGAICILVALAYTELAVMIPSSGGVYSYVYMTFGEIFAWLVLGAMILELAVASSAIASAWAGYMLSILKLANIEMNWLYTAVPAEGGIMNLPAMLISLFVGFMLWLGTKESKKLNIVLVLAKVVAITFFVICASPHADLKNWSNFIPFGYHNIIIGASILFFAYNGFGVIATSAEECNNPGRDLTRAIILSLLIAIVVYITIAATLTLVANYAELNRSDPLAYALRLFDYKIAVIIVSVGAAMGMMAVILAYLYGLTRILYAAARDNVLPPIFKKIHPKYNSPEFCILFSTISVSIIAGFVPIEINAQLGSIGALLDYIFVLATVLVLRIRMPELERKFKCPMIFLVAPTALFLLFYLLGSQLISSSLAITKIGFIVILFFVVMTLIYFFLFMKRRRAISSC